MNPTMSELLSRGVVVIPLPLTIFENFNLDEFLNGQHEFKVSNTSSLFVLGNFGALANPSSQHHPEIRQLRSSVYTYMRSLFETAFEGKYIELIPDRFSIRHQSNPVTAESWHRDPDRSCRPRQ